MKRMWIAVIVSVAAAAAIVGYGIGRARASGIPPTNTLAYTGSLLTFGSPDNGTHTITLDMYQSGTNVCTTTETVTLVNGQFSIPLSATCVTAVHTYPTLTTQVTIDGTAIGQTDVTAVPFAVEAATASNIPTGSTATRPAGVNGEIRFNTDGGNYEIYSNGFWFRQEPLLLSDAARTRAPFTYTGSDQTWTVPSGVTNVFAKVWGAGGAGGTQVNFGYGAAGGGGGHSRGIIPVTGGQVLRIVVGQAGAVYQTAGYGYGGGASATQTGTGNVFGGGGGGYSGVFIGSTPYIIAGGGGGGGCSRQYDGDTGGAGGGTTGQKGESPYGTSYSGGAAVGGELYSYGGNPGTQTAGGAPAGTTNTALLGGNACISDLSLPGTSLQGGHAACESYGGGGGGGYFGGSGGGYAESNTMAGGGGGSGYIAPSVQFGVTLTGDGRSPAANYDPDLSQTGESNTIVAHGGPVSAAGADGFVVLYY